MATYKAEQLEGKDIFVGVDLHLKSWHVTVRTSEVELFSGSICGRWSDLRLLLGRYRAGHIKVVYEAGYFGFWLYDRIEAWGGECLVTPPSLLPTESGNRVKTDKRDSRKLAHLLSRGMLKRVWVPSELERGHRQVVRIRRRLVRDRVAIQLRIKALLRFMGFEIPQSRGNWSKIFVDNLRRLRFGDFFTAQSFGRLLDEYDYLSGEIRKQTLLLKELSRDDLYREKVEILTSIYGIGLVAAMEILLEIGDLARFKRGAQVAAYVGLTPSQYSSGEHIRMGRITGVGKGSVRKLLVEASWKLVSQDGKMRQIYEAIRNRSGAKRAIVAVARRLLLCMRRMLLDRRPYQPLAA